MIQPKVTRKDYQVEHSSDWCPGCGDFGILSAIQQALAKLNLPPHQVAIFGGIGCSGKAQYYVGSYGIHTLHGRPLPYAMGAKLANPELTVLVVAGDGDGLGIGAGHFVNGGRRNVDLTYILFNNEVYGLTKGQAAPTLPLGLKTKSLPEPTIQSRINPLMLALAAGFTWIGRGYAYNVKDLANLIQRAIQHPGLAYLDVLQPCPTYNDLHTKDWYAGKDLQGHSRIYSLQEEGYDPLIPEGADEKIAFEKMSQFIVKANEWGERIPVGIFLENRSLSTFEERICQRIPNYRAVYPARRPIADKEGHPLTDLSPIFTELAMT
ncbi:MAG: 2-oxoacid:ferredoxin oxidoreductase subunit beta [Nitrospinota bacterium]|nr:MAG: 2-oxoacid:ferredoxin oxidoreductase subunit beta [Nitrospinota bacterium]